MRKATIVLLVLLILLVVLPLGMGMALGVCPNSHLPACPSSAAMCFAIVTIVALLPLLMLAQTSLGLSPARRLLLTTGVEHPPRLR